MSIVGLFAGGTASVPVLYQTNPELFHGAVRSAFEEKQPVEPQRPLVVIQKAEVAPERDPVTRRKVRLEANKQGHFSGEFRINGRGVEALVDTGATMIAALNMSTARQLGIQPERVGFQAR